MKARSMANHCSFGRYFTSWSELRLTFPVNVDARVSCRNRVAL